MPKLCAGCTNYYQIPGVQMHIPLLHSHTSLVFQEVKLVVVSVDGIHVIVELIVM